MWLLWWKCKVEIIQKEIVPIEKSGLSLFIIDGKIFITFKAIDGYFGINIVEVANRIGEPVLSSVKEWADELIKKNSSTESLQ